MDLQNDRGIFIVNLLKSIFMKMVWGDVYDILDQNMSDSNVGGRRKKNIRNHLFIINGIINDVVNGKKDAIDIQVIDYRQCFDSMWLSESINDLFETGIQDDNLALIHASNAKNLVAVKTPAGLTERQTIEKIVMQGEVTGPGQCSNQIDTIAKECIVEAKHLYEYKDGLGVPPLGMVDDVIAVSRCGIEAVEMNAYLNQKTRMQKLQFGPEKCHQLHVGKSNICCPELYIDEWRLEKKDNLKTGIENLVDILVDEHKIEQASEEKYLGDIISIDGKNTKNIAARVAKAQGIIKQVRTMLEEMVFGSFVFEVAVVLRNSLFINGILTNVEAAYDLTTTEIESLEKCDEQLIRTILECPCTTPREMLYLELGVTPIRFIVMTRRLMFYHYILNQEKDSLMYKFFQVQSQKPVKGDWSLTVQDDLKTLDINLTEEALGNLSEYSFKQLVSTQIKKETFSFLTKLKESHSKVLHIPYQKHEIQDYLQSARITPDLAKFTFLARSRMIAVGHNYKEGRMDPLCPLCQESDTQSHLMSCSKLNVNVMTNQTITEYSDLFSTSMDKKMAVVKVLYENYRKRKKLIEEIE